jgi:hypothetical protein
MEQLLKKKDMKLNSIEELVRILKEYGEDLIPMTISELKKVERLSGGELPQVYREFLLSMGKGAGRFMQGTSVFYDELFELRDWGNDLLDDNNLEVLSENSFVFWMNQGYQMAYFVLGESENPIIYYFSEGKELKNFVKKDSLLDFLGKQLEMAGLD